MYACSSELLSEEMSNQKISKFNKKEKNISKEALLHNEEKTKMNIKPEAPKEPEAVKEEVCHIFSRFKYSLKYKESQKIEKKTKHKQLKDVFVFSNRRKLIWLLMRSQTGAENWLVSYRSICYLFDKRTYI